jgi:hypothetical protein
MPKGKGSKDRGGEVRDITVDILKDIRTGILRLAQGQDAMRGDIRRLADDMQTVKERLANVLDYTLHRYEDHERRLSSLEGKIAER